MSFYLPIAEIQINILVILFFGFLVGFMSVYLWGGGFLMTPLLLLFLHHSGWNLAQILGSSVSGAIAHGRKKYDYEIGIFLLI